jgi:hypothetical protein
MIFMRGAASRLRRRRLLREWAKLSQSEIRSTNGMIHVLDSFDPGLVHDAVALAQASRGEK